MADNHTDPKRVRPVWRTLLITLGIHLLVMLVLAGVIIYGVTTWLDDYTHHGESVPVPEVVGLDEEEAIRQIEDAGLQAMVVDSLYGEGTPGAVIEQLPEGTLPVKLGRIVYLTINAKAVRMIRMIDVVEWSSRQARSRLREAGFTVDSLHYVPYEFDDLVLAVTEGLADTVRAGEELPYRTHVVLHVGSRELFMQEQDSLMAAAAGAEILQD